MLATTYTNTLFTILRNIRRAVNRPFTNGRLVLFSQLLTASRLMTRLIRLNRISTRSLRMVMRMATTHTNSNHRIVERIRRQHRTKCTTRHTRKFRNLIIRLNVTRLKQATATRQANVAINMRNSSKRVTRQFRRLLILLVGTLTRESRRRGQTTTSSGTRRNRGHAKFAPP